MRLNVYLISHPIIKHLATQFSYFTSQQDSIDSSQHIAHQLHVLLIYEVAKRWIKTDQIYIQNIDCIKELCIFDSKESYLIMANLMTCGNITVDLNHILPKVDIQHINFSKNNFLNTNYYCLEDHIINIMKEKKIIIIDHHLKHSMIELLDYLILQNKIEIENIKVICIECHNNILEKIGSKYSLLKIYTTKIYNN